jgi:UTP--glucose-1-phosphate uridylyltransferase
MGDDHALHAALERMRADGAGEAPRRVFADHWRQVASGATGLIAEADIEPVGALPRLEELADDLDSQAVALRRTVVIRLNGGLGTSMGLHRAKSLLPVRDGLTFLDLIARQVLDLRERHGADVPLLLMDSFSTRADTLEALAAYRALATHGLPLDFLQHRQPKLLVDSLEPVAWPAAPELEWCPPGHGDLYPALVATGLLDRLLEVGMTHAFVANADNLGATLDPRIPAWMDAEGVPFVMEVATRTANDRKGGHLARRRADGQLVLRESAQTSEDDLPALQDVTVHRYMNTNNLWLDLRALARVLAERDGVLGLPLIRNRKTVDPTDPTSAPVYQLESAMGAAIEVFDGARALHVPRSRFAPVKTTDELLLVRSDAYRLDGSWHLELDPVRAGRAPEVALDRSTFGMVDDFDSRFAAGVPSLVACDRFEVTGDVSFGAGVVARGDVRVAAPVGERLDIPAGAVLGA